MSTITTTTTTTKHPTASITFKKLARRIINAQKIKTKMKYVKDNEVWASDNFYWFPPHFENIWFYATLKYSIKPREFVVLLGNEKDMNIIESTYASEDFNVTLVHNRIIPIYIDYLEYDEEQLAEPHYIANNIIKILVNASREELQLDMNNLMEYADKFKSGIIFFLTNFNDFEAANEAKNQINSKFQEKYKHNVRFIISLQQQPNMNLDDVKDSLLYFKVSKEHTHMTQLYDKIKPKLEQTLLSLFNISHTESIVFTAEKNTIEYLNRFCGYMLLNIQKTLKLDVLAIIDAKYLTKNNDDFYKYVNADYSSKNTLTEKTFRNASKLLFITNMQHIDVATNNSIMKKFFVHRIVSTCAINESNKVQINELLTKVPDSTSIQIIQFVGKNNKNTNPFTPILTKLQKQAIHKDKNEIAESATPITAIAELPKPNILKKVLPKKSPSKVKIKPDKHESPFSLKQEDIDKLNQIEPPPKQKQIQTKPTQQPPIQPPLPTQIPRPFTDRLTDRFSGKFTKVYISSFVSKYWHNALLIVISIFNVLFTILLMYNVNIVHSTSNTTTTTTETDTNNLIAGTNPTNASNIVKKSNDDYKKESKNNVVMLSVFIFVAILINASSIYLNKDRTLAIASVISHSIFFLIYMNYYFNDVEQDKIINIQYINGVYIVLNLILLSLNSYQIYV